MKTINKFVNQTNRETDENGYLTVHNCLLLHSGIMEYLGEELINGVGGDVIDEVRINPKKIYKLNISYNELEKAKDTFKLAPIVNGHVFLGVNGENPKDFQEGSVGENLEIVKELDEDGVEKDFLMGTLKFTNPETIELINSGKKEELSTSYSNELRRSDNSDYDFDVINIVANHLALVDKGRAGTKVRVANINQNKGGFSMRKTKNEAVENLPEETVETVTEIEKQESAETTETIQTDNEKRVDKRKIIDEIGGILKGKVDEEIWRTIIKKAETLSYSGSERTESDNEDMEEDDNEKTKTCNDLNGLKEAMYREIKTRLENENKNLLKAYNEVKAKTGDFNFFGMSESDIYKKAFESSAVQLSGNETTGELKAMFRVYNSLDNDKEYEVFSKTSINVPSWCKK